MTPFRGQYPNQSPDTACIENRRNGTSVFRDVFGRTRTEVQALPTASLLSCERNDDEQLWSIGLLNNAQKLIAFDKAIIEKNNIVKGDKRVMQIFK